MQGNGPHQQWVAGVCANANTHKNSNKPKITLSVHVNLPPLRSTQQCEWKGGDTGSAELTSGFLSLVTECFYPSSREVLPAWGTPCSRPMGSGQAGKGQGTQVVRGGRGHMALQGQSYPQSEQGSQICPQLHGFTRNSSAEG